MQNKHVWNFVSQKPKISVVSSEESESESSDEALDAEEITELTGDGKNSLEHVRSFLNSRQVDQNYLKDCRNKVQNAKDHCAGVIKQLRSVSKVLTETFKKNKSLEEKISSYLRNVDSLLNEFSDVAKFVNTFENIKKK